MSIKKRSLKKYIGFFIFIVFAAAIGYYVGKHSVDLIPDVPKLVKIWLVVLFIPAFFIVIGIHEAGHALAGVLLKFDFRMYVVGPFMWEKESGRWKFKWNRNLNTSGGMVICLPTGTENLANRFSLYALGGPLASLVLTVIAYLLYFEIEFRPADPLVFAGVVKYFFLLLSIFSFFILMVTIIPLRMGGFSSDGGRVLQLLSGGDNARFEVLMLKIIGSTTSGLRPSSLNKAELDEAGLLAEKTQAPMGIYMPGIQHQVYFDGGSMDQAENYLVKYVDNADKIPDGLRNGVWVDAAFFYAFGRKDLEKSLMYWDKFQPSAIVAKAQILATEAAISVLRNEYAMAGEKIKASRAEIPNMMDKGVGVALADKLTELEKRISLARNSR